MVQCWRRFCSCAFMSYGCGSCRRFGGTYCFDFQDWSGQGLSSCCLGCWEWDPRNPLGSFPACLSFPINSDASALYCYLQWVRKFLHTSIYHELRATSVTTREMKFLDTRIGLKRKLSHNELHPVFTVNSRHVRTPAMEMWGTWAPPGFFLWGVGRKTLPIRLRPFILHIPIALQYT